VPRCRHVFNWVIKRGFADCTPFNREGIIAGV
jgi:hypothetical protein